MRGELALPAKWVSANPSPIVLDGGLMWPNCAAQIARKRSGPGRTEKGRFAKQGSVFGALVPTKCQRMGRGAAISIRT